MRIRKSLAVVIAATSMLGTALASPAAAAGGGTFQCSGVFPSWPSPGASTRCEGTARGVFQGGAEVVVCLPARSYEMSINYANSCVAGEPSSLAVFAGDIWIMGAGILNADYQAIVVGHHLLITTSSPDGSGHAAMLIHPPLPTCGAPGAARFDLAGSLAFSTLGG